MCGKCTESVWESFFGSGWECRIERKHLWNGTLRRFKEVLSCANLRRRELNPGLPRDRRKYSPLYYSGHVNLVVKIAKANPDFADFCSLRREGHLACQPPPWLPGGARRVPATLPYGRGVAGAPRLLSGRGARRRVTPPFYLDAGNSHRRVFQPGFNFLPGCPLDNSGAAVTPGAQLSEQQSSPCIRTCDPYLLQPKCFNQSGFEQAVLAMESAEQSMPHDRVCRASNPHHASVAAMTRLAWIVIRFAGFAMNGCGIARRWPGKPKAVRQADGREASRGP